MQEFYHKFYSQFIEKEFELLVFGHSGKPLILFPQANGRYFSLKDRGIINYFEEELDKGEVKIYCPDLIDDEIWFTSETGEEKINRYIQFEKLLMYEIIEFAKYETGTDFVSLGGFEFGGYYAANIAFKHQYTVEGLISFDGEYDAEKFLGGFYNDDCYFNLPLHYLGNCTDPWKYNHINIKLGVTKDGLFSEQNKSLSWILNAKGIGHKIEMISPVGNKWQTWRKMLEQLL